MLNENTNEINNEVSASLLIIGDEILSGRTADQNLNFLAKNLTNIGINLKEVRVVGDCEPEIIEAVLALSKKYHYVFTSGGIGPTHDDITSKSIAKAFGEEIILNDQAKQILDHHYGKENVNQARLKMAMIPSTASLLDNPVSSAPGFKINNVFVMAGIPKIFQAMFKCSISQLKTGIKILSKEIITSLTESSIAKDLEDLQNKYPDVSMGSYPSNQQTSLVFRSKNLDDLNQSSQQMIEKINIIKSNSILKIL
jgi:molybdenum cofactor synthesis domain-containing protein